METTIKITTNAGDEHVTVYDSTVVEKAEKEKSTDPELFVGRNCKKLSIPRLLGNLPARDNDAPAKTLAICEKFEQLGLTDFFHYLHHMGISLKDHKRYITNVRWFTNKSNNWFVMWRLESAIEFMGAGYTPKEAIEQALKEYPFIECEAISETGKKERAVKAPRQPKKLAEKSAA